MLSLSHLCSTRGTHGPFNSVKPVERRPSAAVTSLGVVKSMSVVPKGGVGKLCRHLSMAFFLLMSEEFSIRFPPLVKICAVSSP